MSMLISVLIVCICLVSDRKPLPMAVVMGRWLRQSNSPLSPLFFEREGTGVSSVGDAEFLE